MLPLAPLLLLLVPLLTQDSTELLSEPLPDGGWVEREIERDPDGAAINHGSYKSWWDAERKIPRTTGRYGHGQKRATWRTYYPDQRRESKGKYEGDLRVGSWAYWTEQGEPDPERSGDYTVASLAYPGAEQYARGELRDGIRHGRWTLSWPNGARMAEGQMYAGEAVGVWVFQHADGTPDPDWISGEFVRGRRVLPLDDELRATLAAQLPGDEGDEGEQADEADRATISSDLLGPAALGGQLVDARDTLRSLLRLELSDLEQVAVGARLTGLLSDATGGPTFQWRPGVTPEDAAANRLSVLRWTSLWTLLALQPDYGNFEFQDAAARLGSVEEVQYLEGLHPPFIAPVPAHTGADTAVLAGRFERPSRPSKPERRRAEALDDALDWLVEHQNPDGSWSSVKFAANCPEELEPCPGAGQPRVDDGVTGLALLALLGAGNTTSVGPHCRAVARGLAWLLTRQDAESGLCGEKMGNSWIYEHAIANLALAEAAAFSGNPTLRSAAQRATNYTQLARNPHSAWRYDVPPKGQNDTSITGWMLQALDAAGRAGLDVDPAALAGGLAWLDEATDPETGRCGYDHPGSASARIRHKNDDYPTDRAEALTGAALFARVLIGQRPDTSSILARHAELVLTKLPEWDPDGFGCDMYAWYYGSYALYQMGAPYWDPWEKALERALYSGQVREGHAAGSWDPAGPWGFSGGRVYATAMMALCLEAPRRIARLSELDDEQ